MRRDCGPCLINDTEDITELQRVPLNKRVIDEGWLQRALHRSPRILPVEELDDSFAPIVSVGREIRAIDNLFVSAQGRIVLVETKLWRNPEATRQVVAQTLDYAQVLSKLTYEELEAAVKRAIAEALNGRTLYDYIRDSFPDDTPDEASFVDEVTKSLRDARFMLLIVGDGIREGIEEMIDLIHRQPQMLFTFGLVEMQLYKADGVDGMLVVPQIIAHSTEIVRAVVKVEGAESARVTVEVPTEKTAGKSSRRRSLTETEFFESLGDDKTRELFGRLVQLGCELGAEPSFGATGVALRLPHPGGSKQKLSVFALTAAGQFYTWGLNDYLNRAGLDPAIAMEYAERLAAPFPGISVRPEYATLSRYLSATEIEENFDLICDIVTDTVGRIQEAADLEGG